MQLPVRMNQCQCTSKDIGDAQSRNRERLIQSAVGHIPTGRLSQLNLAFAPLI